MLKFFSVGTNLNSQLRRLHPENNPHFKWTDIGCGRLYGEVFSDRVQYASDRRCWFVFDGVRWRHDSEGKRAMEACKTLADALLIYAAGLENAQQKEAYTRFALRWQQRRFRETVLRDASSINMASAADFDKDGWLLNLPNGTLDLRSGELREHRPEDLISKLAGAQYDPQATCPRWTKFIEEITEGDAEKASYLQRALGYCASGSTREEAFFVLYGPSTRNGKGTLMEAVLNVLGDYGRSAMPATITQRQNINSAGPTEDVARLAGARLVNISEPDQQMVLSSALVKTLTGNDRITARFLHEGSFEFRPGFKLAINTNHLPKVTDPTIFASGRVRVIPFLKHFSEAEQDKDLKSALAQEDAKSAILNWLLEGLVAYLAVGLNEPESVRAATAQYRYDSDKLIRFFDEELERGDEFECKPKDVYRRFVVWTSANGFGQPSYRTFLDGLRANFPVVERRPKSGGEKTTLILDYRLRVRDQPYSDGLPF